MSSPVGVFVAFRLAWVNKHGPRGYLLPEGGGLKRYADFFVFGREAPAGFFVSEGKLLQDFLFGREAAVGFFIVCWFFRLSKRNKTFFNHIKTLLKPC